MVILVRDLDHSKFSPVLLSYTSFSSDSYYFVLRKFVYYTSLSAREDKGRSWVVVKFP